jgi:hypothetical protein
MRVGDQFVRGGIGGLFAVTDRCDNVPRKEVQADQASGGAGLAHVFMGGDVFDRGARIVCKAFAEDIGANEKSDRLKRGELRPGSSAILRRRITRTTVFVAYGPGVAARSSEDSRSSASRNTATARLRSSADMASRSRSSLRLGRSS